MRRWRQPNNHQRGVGIAETGHCPAPVLFVAIGGSFLDSNLFAPFDESRAQTTILDFDPKLVQWFGVHSASFAP